MVRKGKDRDDIDSRIINGLEKFSASGCLYYSSNNIHGNRNGEVWLDGCVIRNQINNCKYIRLADSEINAPIISSNINWTGFHHTGTDYNSDNVINAKISQCRITDMFNCTIDAPLDYVDLKSVKNLTIPADKIFIRCDFTQISQWAGLNVWDANPLTLRDKVISKRYADSDTSPTVEKLWYEETDINGVTNLIEVQ